MPPSDYARAHGATMLEAYPVDTSGERIVSANAYHGTLRMFERAGFTVAERRQWNKTSPVRPDRPPRVDIGRNGRVDSRSARNLAASIPPHSRRGPEMTKLDFLRQTVAPIPADARGSFVPISS